MIKITKKRIERFVCVFMVALTFISLSGCDGDFKKQTVVFKDQCKIKFSIPKDWFYTVSEADNNIIIADNDLQDYSNGRLIGFISVLEDSECENLDDLINRPTSPNVSLETLFKNENVFLYKNISQPPFGTEPMISYGGFYYNKNGKHHCMLRPLYEDSDEDVLKKILTSISISELN